MTDSFGRVIDYLRLSVTARCNLNCAYCKRAAGGPEMTLEEITRIVWLFSQLGIRKIRLTGGEPLIREDILEIIRISKAEIPEVALTTNGVLLPDMAPDLKAAGLDRVNISVDTLEDGALAGMDAAIAAGLTPVKINTVLMRGVNDMELNRFIALTENRDVQVRLIEYMPMGGQEGLYIPAQDVNIQGKNQKISCITSVSRPFCHQCNRVRVTPDCKIRLCLGNNMEFDLRSILQQDDNAALDRIQEAVAQKPQKGFCEGFVTNRGMGNIGG